MRRAEAEASTAFDRQRSTLALPIPGHPVGLPAVAAEVSPAAVDRVGLSTLNHGVRLLHTLRRGASPPAGSAGTARPASSHPVPGSGSFNGKSVRSAVRSVAGAPERMRAKEGRA